VAARSIASSRIDARASAHRGIVAAAARGTAATHISAKARCILIS